MDDCLDCPVCYMPFSNTARRPRSLPCGHTLCSHCIQGVTKHGCVHCPTCCVHHAVPEGGEFPVAYALETIIEKLRAMGVPGTRAQQEVPEELGLPVQSMLQLQKAEMVAAIQACREEEARLDQYRSSLASWTKQQHQLQEKLEALLECSRSTSLLVQDVESRAAAKKDEIQQGRQQLQSQLDTLDYPTSRKEAYAAVEDAVRVTQEAKLRTGECQAAFPDEETTSAISRVREATTSVVEAAHTAKAALDTPAAADAPASLPTITKTQQTLQPPPLMAQDLLSLTQSAWQHLNAGHVYAVQHTPDQTRYGRIILQDGRLYLHALVDQPPLPPGSVTVQVEEVVPDGAPCLVFLDLAWPGSTPRRVLIRLSPNTARGHQFMLLCTGQRGHTYANTKLFAVGNRGRPGEFVRGGDYQYDNGDGGAALLTDLDTGQYQKPGQAGDVWGLRCSNTTNAAQFFITTRGMLDSYYVNGFKFGKVEVGLEDVVEATQHRLIKRVTVVECGVVLKE